jgi:hypothetical protein
MVPAIFRHAKRRLLLRMLSWSIRHDNVCFWQISLKNSSVVAVGCS